MKNTITIFVVFTIVAGLGQAQEVESGLRKFPTLSGPYLGQEPPGMTPELFAPGILPVEGIQHSIPYFTSDGREAYWMVYNMSDERPRGEIWFMEEKDETWTEPAVASFSGWHSDISPFVSGDGQRVYFSSTRHAAMGARPNLWYVERTSDGWGVPVRRSAPPNSEVGVSQATLTDAGSIYFAGKRDSVKWNVGLYVSEFVDSRFLEPALLGGSINTEHAEAYPYVAPDESFLLFGSSRPGARSVETDLYIAFREDGGGWGEPIHLGEEINNGKTVSFTCVTHDGKYLFFNRFDGEGEESDDKFFWVDAKILDKYRP